MPEEVMQDPIFTRGLKLPEDSLHMLSHWRRVEKFGLMIADKEGSDKKVISWFACLHDARRENDGDDPDHGKRAADLLDELKEEGLVSLSNEQYQQLKEALINHNKDDAASDDVTVRTCWDADRLDLWRAGIKPNPKYMFTDFGRSQEMIDFSARLNGIV